MAQQQHHQLLLTFKDSDFGLYISECGWKKLQYKTHPDFWPSPPWRQIFKTSLYYQTRLIKEIWWQHGLTLIPVWISNHMPSNVWDEITCLFPNFSGSMDKLFHLTFWNGCNYLSMAGLKLNHVSKRGSTKMVSLHNGPVVRKGHTCD